MSDELKQLNNIIQRENDKPLSLADFETLKNVYAMMNTRTEQPPEDAVTRGSGCLCRDLDLKQGSIIKPSEENE